MTVGWGRRSIRDSEPIADAGLVGFDVYLQVFLESIGLISDCTEERGDLQNQGQGATPRWGSWRLATIRRQSDRPFQQVPGPPTSGTNLTIRERP